MSISLEKQTLTLIKTVERNAHLSWIEQDILVPDTKPDVMKLIRVEAVPLIANVDVIDGAIRISGEITYYILYRSVEGNKTKGMSMTYPYSQTINVSDAKKGMRAIVRCRSKKCNIFIAK